MTHVITFRTSKFDVSKETPNDINPIAGESVLQWLCEELEGSSYESTRPSTEDWGWYVYVSGANVKYLVGASADATEPAASVDWTIQIHKERSLKDKVTGANKLTPDDALSALIERIIRDEPSIADLEIDRSD
jgi:hypothetical protein